MRVMMLALLLIFVGTSAFAIAAGHDLSAQTRGPQVTTIVKTDGAGEEDKEWKVLTVELAPGAGAAHHSYSGIELVYVLAGAGLLEADGTPPVALNAGTVATLHPKHIHVLKNTSQSKKLKALLVVVLEKGQSRRALTDRGMPRTAIEPIKSTDPGLVF